MEPTIHTYIANELIMAEPNWQKVQEDKEQKKQAVTSYIASKCKVDSDTKVLRNIGASLSNGAELKIDILTGGLANYTYKISCKDTNNISTEHKLFAKLSFPFAQLFPDKPCPLSRTQNEFEMMRTFHKLSPGLVASPYFCDDIGEDMKLLVTHWSPVDEQFGNQFIDGTVDMRTATTIAEGISNLHCFSGIDLDFNSSMRPWFHSLTPILKDIVNALHKSENQDRVGARAKEVGENATSDMFDSYVNTLDVTECLIHGDLHTFNILVGAKPSIETLENFDASGSVVLCDWEMAHGGTAGHDIGTLRSFPISCAFAHSINGHRHAALDCLSWLNAFWSSYEAAVRKANNSEEQVTRIFRHSLQYSALYLLGHYALNIHIEFLPIDEGNVEDLTKVKESIGLVGLKYFEWGMDESLSLDELKANYSQAIEEEMTMLLSIKKVRRSRRASVLRASGRRVSDANLYFAAPDRVSIISADGSAIISKLKTLPSETEIGHEVSASAQ